jgi:hypothetical protein
LARWIRISLAVMCSMARLACLIMVISFSPATKFTAALQFVKDGL